LATANLERLTAFYSAIGIGKAVTIREDVVTRAFVQIDDPRREPS
jgi:hypothetical protein